MAGRKAPPRVERAKPPEPPERLIGPSIVEEFLTAAEIERLVAVGDPRWPLFGAENEARHRQQSQREAWVRVTFPELAGAGWPRRRQVLERAGIQFTHGRPQWRDGRPDAPAAGPDDRAGEHSQLTAVLRPGSAAEAAEDGGEQDGHEND